MLLFIVLAFWTKPLWEESIEKVISDTISSVYSIKTNSEQEQREIEKLELAMPEKQVFSIGNIEVGDTKADVEKIYGEPKRQSKNEYGIYWTTYHENYQNFIMVSYDEQEVVRGLFTNQDLVSSQWNLAFGDKKTTVEEILGKPEEVIRNGWINYRINSEGEYGVYKIDGSYVTIFYDVHEDEILTAIQIIDSRLQDSKDDIYTLGNEALKEGFEYQLFDLTNATRVNYGYPILEWDEAVRKTARKHSADMSENQFFGHTNLQGQSPFDRMEEDGILFATAGENLAYGQFSSIFAHQGLMNSLGHRENILQESFTKMGIGVDFDENNQPFYTEKFFSNQWL